MAPKNTGPQENGEFAVKTAFAQAQEGHDLNGGAQSQRNMKMQSPQNLAGYQQHQQVNPHAAAPHMMQHQAPGYGHQGSNQAYGYQQPKIMSNQMPQQHGQQMPNQHAVMQHQRPPNMQQQQHSGYPQHPMHAQYQQQYPQHPQQQYPGHPGGHIGAPQGSHPYGGQQYGQQHQSSTSPQNMSGSAPQASSYYNQYLPYIKYQQQQLELNQQKKQAQSSPSKEANTNILDKAKLKEMCGELCGNRDVLDDKVTNVLAAMVDQMVENLVDYSCMYANHRDSDTLEKEDVQFAVSRLFPEISRDHKVRDIQLTIDQQVNSNHPNVNQVSSAANFQNQAVGGTGINIEAGGTSIGVGGHISTSNYKGQLLRVRREQDQRAMITNLLKNSKSNPNNADQHHLADQRRGTNQPGGGSTHQNHGEQNKQKQ